MKLPTTPLTNPQKTALLRQAALLSGLGAGEIEQLAALGIERSFRPGEFILLEGDAAEWFYLVLDGKVKVLKQTPAGKDFILAVFLPGEVFGAVAAFKGIPYPASAQAIERTIVLGLNRSDLLSLMRQNPAVALKIINILSERLEKAHNRLRDLAAEKAEQRVCRMLIMLSAKLGPTVPFTKQEIADMSGTTRETTIRVMSRLATANIIRSSRGKITIQDERRLRLLAEGPPAV